MIKSYLSKRASSKYATYVRLINSWRWQQLRKRKFLANPICEDCLKRGRITPTIEVHHIRPVESGRNEREMTALAYDYSNLLSLCKACHAAKHAPKQPELKGCDKTKAFARRFFGLCGESI